MVCIVVAQAYIEKEDSKKLKQKQKERMQPKVGKTDIDYQVIIIFLTGVSCKFYSIMREFLTSKLLSTGPS